MTHDLAGVQRHPSGSAELRREALAIVGEAARAGERAGLVTPPWSPQSARTKSPGDWRAEQVSIEASTVLDTLMEMLQCPSQPCGDSRPRTPRRFQLCSKRQRTAGRQAWRSRGGVRPQQQGSLEKTQNFWRFSDASCLDLWRKVLWVLGMRSRG
jgi:hypothetical protein